MGSLHCARICMDVIAALIGRRWGPPHPLPRAPRLGDAAARGPAPRGRAAGPRGRGGAGVLRAEGAGRGLARCRPQAGGGDLERLLVEQGFTPQVEVSQVSIRASHVKDQGLGSRGMGKNVAGVPQQRFC